jgi:hypothetical protein
MVFADGSSFNGQWKDDKYDGDGVFKFPDGTERRGIWKNGNIIKWRE